MATLGKTTITDLSVYNTIHGKIEQADKVTITSGSSDAWRNMLVTGGANDIFSVPNVYANYSKGALKAKSLYITGSANNTTAHITSDTTNNMYFSIDGVIPLVINTSSTTNPCVRASNTLSGAVDLGSSSCTWRNVYSNLLTTNRLITGGDGNAVCHIKGVISTVDYTHIYAANSDGSNTTRPLILQNGYGNVGIGTDAPSEKLEVNGNIKATSFNGSFNGSINAPIIGSSSADLDSFFEAGKVKFGTFNSAMGITNTGMAGNDGLIISHGFATGSNRNYGYQLALDDNGYNISFRYNYDNTWATWKKLAFVDGTGATGTWPISITGNATSSTKTGDGTNILYTEKQNEINFGGTSNSGTIYFGYRATDSKPIPTKYVFGGSTGTAELAAKTFIGNVTGNATSATTASKLSNTTAIGSVSEPVYFTANGIPAVCSQAIKTVAIYDKAENRLKTSGWYRIARLDSYGSYLLSIAGSYNNVNSTAASFIINKSYTSANIHQLSPASVASMITKVRLVVGETSGTIYVEVYNNYTSAVGEIFVYRITTLMGINTTGSDVVIQDPVTVTHSLTVKQELTIVTSTTGLIPAHTHAIADLPTHTYTSAQSLGWTSTIGSTKIPTINTIAFWNGAWDSNGSSNLAYCNKGAFGTIVTKNIGDYLPISGGALTGPITFNLTDADRNIIRINNGTGDATTTSNYGFTLKYLGSGSGDNNSLALFSDNSTATAQNKSFEIKQSGNIHTRNIIPLANNTYSLGNSSYKWANVYATTFTGNLSGNVTGNLTGNVTGSATKLGSTTIAFTPAETDLTPDNIYTLVGGTTIKRGTWSYAGNGYISNDTTGVGTIDLAGTTVIQADGGDSNTYTQLYLTPSTGSTTGCKTNEIFMYNNNGSGYSPSWTRVLTHRNYTDYCAEKSHNHSASSITSGTLSVSRGGTGLSTITAGHVIIGNGTGTPTTAKIISLTNTEIDDMFEDEFGITF